MIHTDRRATTASLAMCVLLPSLGTSIANVALPTLATAFGTTSQHVKWVVLAYLIAVTALIVWAGRLGDVIGRRRLLFIGITMFAVGSVLCGAAPTLNALIAARAVQGTGAAVMMAMAMALVEPRALGVLGTMSAVGTALGPSMGGFLIATFGWRSVFLVKVPIALVTLAATALYVPKEPVAAPHAQRVSGMRSMLDALRSRSLAAGLATSWLVATVVMATLIVGPFYLTTGLGLGPRAVGLSMATGPIVAAFTSAPAGRVVARIGAARVTVGGVVGVLAASLVMALLPLGAGVAGYVIPLVILTAGYAAFQTANNTAVMLAAKDEDRGVVSGMLNLSRNLGLITGASVMGTVFSVASGAAGSGAYAASVGMRATFGVGAALMVVALAVGRGARSPSTADH